MSPSGPRPGGPRPGTTSVTGLAEGETSVVDQAISRVEALYRALTGRDAPEAGAPTEPIPVEKNPGQFVEEQLDRLLGALAEPSAIEPPRWCPLVAASEEADELTVWFDLPGVERSDLEVELDGNVLSVRGRRTVAAANPDAASQKGSATASSTAATGPSGKAKPAATAPPASALDGKPARRLRLDERPSGPFARQVLLRPAVHWSAPRARLADGVLEVQLTREPPSETAPRVVAVG